MNPSDRSLLQRNEIVTTEVLLEGWAKVVRVIYRQHRRDATWQVQERDLLDRGHGVSVLLYNREKDTVLLLRQPRVVATMHGDPHGETIEVCSGLIDADEDPLACAYRETEQETGHRPSALTPVTEVYASPGGSLEIVHLFLGEYDETTRVAAGGGLSCEGEDIEVIEVPVEDAIEMIRKKIIRDARTILLIQFLYIQQSR